MMLTSSPPSALCITQRNPREVLRSSPPLSLLPLLAGKCDQREELEEKRTHQAPPSGSPLLSTSFPLARLADITVSHTDVTTPLGL